MRYRRLVIFILSILILFSNFNFVNAEIETETEEPAYNHISLEDVIITKITDYVTFNGDSFDINHTGSRHSYDILEFTFYLDVEKDKIYDFAYDFDFIKLYGSTTITTKLVGGGRTSVFSLINNASFNSTNSLSFVSNVTGIVEFKFSISTTYEKNKANLRNFRTTAPLPDKLSNFNLYLESTVNKISATWNSVTNADFYELYLNNMFIGTVTDTNYIFQNLLHDKEYTVEVIAKSSTHSPSKSKGTIRTRNYFVGRPDGNSEVGRTWGKIIWQSVEDTNYYEVRLGNGSIIKVTDLEYTFRNLTEDTDYIAYIRQVSKNGESSDWTEVKFRTLPPLELPPPIPKGIKLVNRGLDFLEVEVYETVDADGYIFYLFGNEISKQTDRFIRIDNLEPSTNYSISVSAYNKYGNSYKAFSYFTTLNATVPSVISAESKAKRVIENGKETVHPNIQDVSWKTQNVNEGVKVSIDGIEVGIFKDINAVEINIDEIEGLEIKDFYEIEIVPVDEGGVPYKFKISTKSSGNNSLDLIVDDIKNSIGTIGKYGMILLLALLGFVILFFGILWLFSKWKLEMSTKTPDMLNDTTLNVNSPYLHEKGEGATMVDKQVAKAEKEYERIYRKTLAMNNEQTNKYLQGQKINDLKQIAKIGSIDGYSQMTKEQLANSIVSNRDEISKFIKSDLKSDGSPKLDNKSKNNKSNKNQSFLSYVVENSMKGGVNRRRGSYRKGNSNYKSNRVLQLENQILRLEKENLKLKLKKGSDS